MAAKEEIIPDYLYAFKDEASLWANIQLRFDALSTLFDMRLETEVEAIGHKEKRFGWMMPLVGMGSAHGCSCRTSMPSIKTDCRSRSISDAALSAQSATAPRNRGLSRHCSRLGRFCAAAGLIVISSPNLVGHKRSALPGGEAKIVRVAKALKLKSAVIKGGGGLGNIDFLATGKMTVMPPSIYPDTGKPYETLGQALLAVERRPSGIR